MFKTGIILASLIRTIPAPTTEDMVTLQLGGIACGVHLTVDQEGQLLSAYGVKQTTTTYFKKRQKMVADMFVADPRGSCDYARDVYAKFFTLGH